MSFADLGLAAPILRAVADQGYSVPTPIQQQAIPVIMAGHDLMACAQTGTGKTAGFTLPLLHRLQANASQRNPAARGPRRPRALILTPTRELALQVCDNVQTYGKHLRMRSVAILGGMSMHGQIQNLRRGSDILVATPGRLLDHHKQGTVDLSQIEILVLDEADRMLDMGFIPDIRRILEILPEQRQNMLFSATFTDSIRDLAQSFLCDPQIVEVARRNTVAESVSQRVIEVEQARKKELLLHLMEQEGWNQVLVFTRTKHGADALAEKLDRAGVRSTALHGNKTQGARNRALADFKSGRVTALVATDIAARGLDIDALPYVVNFDLPNVPEDYVHRIGRTGRAGAEGEAISLVCRSEHGFLRDIERLIKRELPCASLPGFEPPQLFQRGERKSDRPRRRPMGNSNGGRSFSNNRPPRSNNGEGGYAARGDRPARSERSEQQGGYGTDRNATRGEFNNYTRNERSEHAPRAERGERNHNGERRFNNERAPVRHAEHGGHAYGERRSFDRSNNTRRDRDGNHAPARRRAQSQ